MLHGREEKYCEEYLNNLLVELGLEDEKKDYDATKCLLKLLKKGCQEVDGDLTLEKARNIGWLPSRPIYRRYFGTWNKAKKEANQKLNTNLNIFKKKSNNFKNPDSYSKYNKEKLLKFVKQKKKEMGRLPKAREVDNDENLPSWGTYYNHFGSWSEVIKNLKRDEVE